MFRPVRRKKNEISSDAVKKLLSGERRGILAVNGEDGYPYAVPINYLYCEEENRIIFHGSHAGYKAEMLKNSDKVCFTVYGDVTVKDEEWAPYVKSAVVFGRCRPSRDRAETEELLRRFAEKYYPDADMIEEEIAASGKAVRMYIRSPLKIHRTSNRRNLFRHLSQKFFAEVTTMRANFCLNFRKIFSPLDAR